MGSTGSAGSICDLPHFCNAMGFCLEPANSRALVCNDGRKAAGGKAMGCTWTL